MICKIEPYLKTYNIIKTLLIIVKTEIINKKKFEIVALNKNIEIFIMYIVAFNISLNIYLS